MNTPYSVLVVRIGRLSNCPIVRLWLSETFGLWTIPFGFTEGEGELVVSSPPIIILLYYISFYMQVLSVQSRSFDVCLSNNDNYVEG